MNKISQELREKIQISCDTHNYGDISSEALLQMICDDCDCDVETVLDVIFGED